MNCHPNYRYGYYLSTATLPRIVDVSGGHHGKKLFLKPREFAAAISASPSKVYEGIANGSIPSVRIAGLLRVPASYAAELEKAARAPEVDDAQ
jgi:hypothetical protein